MSRFLSKTRSSVSCSGVCNYSQKWNDVAPNEDVYFVPFLE